MDMRNVAVGMVIEVIAATMAPQVMEDENTSPTLFHDDTAIVVECPWTAGNNGHIVLVGQCERPMSGDVGRQVEMAIAV